MWFAQVDRFYEINKKRPGGRKRTNCLKGLSFSDESQLIFLVLNNSPSAYDSESIIAVGGSGGGSEIIDPQRGAAVIVQFEDDHSVILHLTSVGRTDVGMKGGDLSEIAAGDPAH